MQCLQPVATPKRGKRPPAVRWSRAGSLVRGDRHGGVGAAERPGGRSSVLGGEELPRPRHTLQLVGTAVVEAHARTRNEIDDRPGDEDVAGCRECPNSGTDVHGEAGNVVAALFDLASV